MFRIITHQGIEHLIEIQYSILLSDGNIIQLRNDSIKISLKCVLTVPYTKIVY